MFKRSGGSAQGVEVAHAVQRAGAASTRDFSSAEGGDLEAEIAEWLNTRRPLLGAILIELGYISGEQLADALVAQRDEPLRVGALLVQRGWLSEHRLARALAIQFEIPLADLTTERPQPEALEAVGEELTRTHLAVPLRVADGRVYIAVADPLDAHAIRSLAHVCGRIGLLAAPASDILRVIDTEFSALRSADVHIQAFELADDTIAKAAHDNRPMVDENAPVVQVVNRLILQGVRSRASDIHVEPQEHATRVRYRVDGALSDAIELPLSMSTALASRIKVLAELNIVERRRPQDGQFSMVVDGRPIDIRTSLVSTIHGEKVVLRILDKTQSLISLDQLGMPAGVVEKYLKIVKAPLGMLLCTGPTGSGKTTTLYSTLAEVNDPRRNVVTIEDPVEYEFAGINQMQVSDASGFTFAEGLRGTLRQDPDVILVGEIRDEETARIATQAALTGHFVLSSLHAVDAVSAVHRFIDMGIEPFLIASAINGVVGQRLVRRTCSGCVESFEPTLDQVRNLVRHTGTTPDKWLQGTGCNLCNGTGYRGRIGVYELLEVTDEIRELVVQKATHTMIRKMAISQGMSTMLDEALDLVLEGVTTMDEVIRSVYAPTMETAHGNEILALASGPKGIPDHVDLGGVVANDGDDEEGDDVSGTDDIQTDDVDEQIIEVGA